MSSDIISESAESSSLKLNATANTLKVPANQSFLLYLLAEVAGVGEPGAAAKTAVNLNLVIDISDSMRLRVATDEQLMQLARMGMIKEVIIDGVPAWDARSVPPDVLEKLPTRISMVKEALREVVNRLRPEDYFSLVVFAGKAVVLVQNTPGSEKSRLLKTVGDIEDVHLGDETFIGRGMEKGLDEAKKRMGPGITTRLLILTDGFTQDEGSCLHFAGEAKKSKISISTMGLMGTFNEDLLIPMADDTGGHAHFVQELADLPGAFAEEWEAVQTVAYRDLDIKLQLTRGVEARRTYRVKPAIGEMELEGYEDSYTLLLGDLELKNPPTLLCELILPPRVPGKYRVAQLLLSHDDAEGNKLRGERRDVVVEYVDSPVSRGDFVPRVMNFVEMVTAHRLQSEGMRAAESGDTQGATRKLRAAATRLLDMGEGELAETVNQQADELESQGSMDGTAAKKVKYETRRLTTKLE